MRGRNAKSRRTVDWLLPLLFAVIGSGLLAGQNTTPVQQPSATAVAPAKASQQDVTGSLKLSANSLTFGKEQVKSSSAPQVITITNSGNSEVMIKELASTAPDFALVHNCWLAPDPFPAGASCNISVRFVPSAAGTRSGNIAIQFSGDPAPQALSIALQGNGVEGPVTLSQTYLAFRTMQVGITSMPQFVVLTNQSSTAPAIINRITVSSDFSLATTGGQCTAGKTLAPLKTCRFAVVWAPTDSGSRSGQVTITDSDVASPHIVHLQGSATGLSFSSTVLNWNPTAVGVAGDSQSILVRNEGHTAIEIGKIEASGDFSQQNNCSQQLAEHQSCTVNVRFQPSAAGKRAGTILIHDSDAVELQQVFLTGVGSALDLSPAKMDFGDRVAGSTSAPRTVTVTNHGAAKVEIAAVNVSGDFVVPGKTCGETIAAGQTCRLKISFSPTASGARTGVLSIATSAGNVPQQVSLVGRGR